LYQFGIKIKKSFLSLMRKTHVIFYCKNNMVSLIFLNFSFKQWNMLELTRNKLSATFNNISVISWRSILLVEGTGAPGENQHPAASHWLTLSHNVVSSTPRLSGIRIRNVSGDMYSKCKRTQNCMETTIVLRIDGFLLTTLYLLFKYLIKITLKYPRHFSCFHVSSCPDYP
jgi:hypothetical protein